MAKHVKEVRKSEYILIYTFLLGMFDTTNPVFLSTKSFSVKHPGDIEQKTLFWSGRGALNNF